MPESIVPERPLAEQIPRGEAATHTADAVGALWLAVDAVLHPIIGRGGVAALFNRSVRLTTGSNPWLAIERCDRLSDDGLAPLRAVLAGQGAIEAEVAGRALFSALESLLASLVGTSLMQRLLHPVRRGRP